MARLVYIPPTAPIPFALPIAVTLPLMAFLMARVGIHVVTGPGAVAEGHSHVRPLLLGLLAGVAVLGLDRLLRRRIPPRLRSPRVTRLRFGGTVLLVAAIAGLVGLRLGTLEMRGLRPMMLINMGKLVLATVPVGNDSTLPSRLLVGPTLSDTLTMLGQSIRVEKDSTSLILASTDGTRRLTIPLPALEMPQQVEIVPVRAAAEPVAFALLVTGSARSNQAMFAVVDSTWRLIFLERMYRFWPAAPRVLTLQRDSVTNFDVMMVARAELTRRLYRFVPE